MNYDTKNWASLQELPDKLLANFRKKTEDIIIFDWEKGKYKYKCFSKNTRVGI